MTCFCRNDSAAPFINGSEQKSTSSQMPPVPKSPPDVLPFRHLSLRLSVSTSSEEYPNVREVRTEFIPNGHQKTPWSQQSQLIVPFCSRGEIDAVLLLLREPYHPPSINNNTLYNNSLDRESWLGSFQAANEDWQQSDGPPNSTHAFDLITIVISDAPADLLPIWSAVEIRCNQCFFDVRSAS